MIQHRWGVELSEGRAAKAGYEMLPTIRTARTERAINRAVTQGFFPLVKPVVPSPDVHFVIGVDQDPETGTIKLLREVRLYSPNTVINFIAYYPYNFPSPFAAYLIPEDLVPGDKVWIEDLIEDIVAVLGDEGNQPRLACAPAVWDGEHFEIQFDVVNEADAWMS